MGFEGLRVIALESRRAAEMAELIRRQGGEPFVAPSLRELPVERNQETFHFAQQLFDGFYDQMIFLTGVGARGLARLLAERFGDAAFPDALRRLQVVARGPKPASALREMQVPVHLTAPSPNPSRELLAALEGRTGRRIAVQEYGKSNTALLDALGARAETVTSVRVYRWDLPEDTAPLQEAARRIAAGQADVLLLTTAIQIPHLLSAGDEPAIRRGLERLFIASIGPSTTEALQEFGLRADFEPSQPKMGFLVREAADHASRLRRPPVS
jgi:uroporphyrinogen-III synthase